jgi:hypothetical protein
MSYSFLLVRVPPGASEEEVGKLADAASEAEPDSGSPDPAAEQRRRALAAALLAECPELQSQEHDYATLARADDISEAEARQRYRWLTVVGPEDGAGIEITIYDSFVSVEMSSSGGTSDDWEDVWRYLEILVREGGFVVWDPQGEGVVDLSAGPLGDGKRKPRKEPAKRKPRTGGDADDGDEAEVAEDVETEDVRRGGAIGKLINRIVDEAIAAPLAAAGFRRSGRTWRRQPSDGVTQVVNVQWSPRDDVEGSFMLNSGVYFTALAELIAELPVTAAPKEYDCHVRRRSAPAGRGGWQVRVPGIAKPDPDMKGLIGDFFSWLDRRADRKAPEQHTRATRELREALETDAFPWLERVSTLRGAREEFLRRGPAFWVAHASLLLGEREEAARVVERELASAKSERAEMIRAWGRRHGLVA